MKDLPDAYTDEDQIDFGMHNGSSLEDVPASYLVWLWEEGLKDQLQAMTKRGRLARYIFNCRGALGIKCDEQLKEAKSIICPPEQTFKGGRVIVFDTETSNLPDKGQYSNPRHKNTPRLVELGAIRYGIEGEIEKKVHHIIKPVGFTISPEVSKIHGITHERAMDEGKDIREVIQEFHQISNDGESWFVCDGLVAHNLMFDLLVYEGECIKLGISPILKVLKRFCTKELSTSICKIPSPWNKGFKWPTLQEAYKHFFGQEFVGAHGAMADLQATYQVFRKIFNLEVK